MLLRLESWRRGDVRTGRRPRPIARAATAAYVAIVCLTGAAGIFAQAPGEPGQDGPATDAPSMSLGMNLSAIQDWNREWVFVDVFRQSRPWIPQTSGKSRPWKSKAQIEVDDLGWPRLTRGQAAGTVMFSEQDGKYPGGLYTCTYEGQGRIAFGFDAKVVAAGPGRIEIFVSPTNKGIYLRIDESRADDPVRNIRVVMPGFESGQVEFHPVFIERLRPWKVLRFMDWGCTNDSTLAHWSDRTRPDQARQNDPGGVAIEIMIDLCNELGADPWLCMPHLAEDDYVRSCAEVVLARLAPDRRVYVEWSNEAWNSRFAQAKWVQAAARELGLKAPQVTADEALRDWRIWREVFRGQAHRVVRVAAGQQRNPWVAKTLLERLDGEFDAVSCSGYFRPDKDVVTAYTAATTAQDVLDDCLADLDGAALPGLAAHAQLAQEWTQKLSRHIPLVVYEGGQHLTAAGKDVPYEQAFAAAQTDQRMGEAYDRLFQGAAQLGVELFVCFNYVGRQTRWGCWGHLQFQDEPFDSAPKYLAALRAAGAVPP
jgi:hypothetical protein